MEWFILKSVGAEFVVGIGDSVIFNLCIRIDTHPLLSSELHTSFSWKIFNNQSQADGFWFLYSFVCEDKSVHESRP